MKPSYACATFILLCQTLVFVSLSNGTQIASHAGSNDPETEGWTKYRSFTNVATFPVVNDLGSGINAWAVDDNGNLDGFYGRDFTSQQITDAFADGWKMSTSLRVVDFRQFESGGSAIDVQLSIPFRVFGLRFGHESDGSPLVIVQGEPGVLDLDDLDSGYHLYELVYNPLSDKASFYVDGVLRLSDIAGGTGLADPEANLLFGTRLANGEGDGQGQGNYSSVLFTIISEPSAVPEPSTFALAALGLLGLGCVALRKKYRRV